MVPNSTARFVSHLSGFAKRTRYYNLASLSGGKAGQMSEPIRIGGWKSARQSLMSLHTYVICHDEARQTISGHCQTCGFNSDSAVSPAHAGMYPAASSAIYWPM